MLGLINDILDFSKIEAGKLVIENTRFKLEKLLQRSVNLSAISAHAKGLELVTDVDPRVPEILFGDPLRLQQIIVNLVNNAVKFTDKGTVCIKTDLKEETDSQIVLQYFVIDRGIDMDEEQQGKVFQLFSQADESVTRKYGGTGLGLTISKQLCELMGGEFWLESEVGQGSAFHFTLIFDKMDEQADVLPIDKYKIAQLKVMVVDDTTLSRTVIVELLAELGIKATQVDSGAEAINRVKLAIDEGKPYDVVLLDWRMPEMDGIETSRRIYSNHQKDPPHILMVSAYDKEEAKRQLAGTQIQQLIEKPINKSALVDAITNMLAGKMMPLLASDVEISDIPDLSSSRILLVEDNAINQQVALGFLKDTGVKVECAENGLIALRKLQEADYDLVLMDIQMPEMD
ncbi:MAG: response regulator [Alteromonadaceae bacterium]|nr:response regulator [Alteromonadaceae bacterium]